MAAYPRVPHGLDGDDVSQQGLVDRDDAIDDGLKDAEVAMLSHTVGVDAHLEINPRFAPASHVTDEARHVGTGELFVPTPPATGRFHLEANNGTVSWIPFP